MLSVNAGVTARSPRGFPPVADPDSRFQRAEELAESMLPARAPKKRMLVIANPYATTVSDRLRNLVVYALQARYEVEAVNTKAANHATELCASAAAEGYDVVVAFGGDGTVNEAANGLAGSDTPLACLPGGATNVFHRAIGVSTDVVDATEQLLLTADDFRPRRIDLGRVNDRYFTFAAGVGLDASVVERVDAHPRLKARFGEYYYTWAAVSTFSRRYLFNPPHVQVAVNGKEFQGVTAIAQNSDEYTYFGKRPIRLSPDVRLDDGTFGLVILKRARPIELPTVGWRAFSGRAKTIAKHRQVESLPGTREAMVTATDGGSFPVQVDGDFIGQHESALFTAAPGALWIVT